MGITSKIAVVLIQIFSVVGGIVFLLFGFAVFSATQSVADGILLVIASILCFGLFSMIALFDGAVAEMQKSLSLLPKIAENTKRAEPAPVNANAQKTQTAAGDASLSGE